MEIKISMGQGLLVKRNPANVTVFLQEFEALISHFIVAVCGIYFNLNIFSTF